MSFDIFEHYYLNEEATPLNVKNMKPVKPVHPQSFEIVTPKKEHKEEQPKVTVEKPETVEPVIAEETKETATEEKLAATEQPVKKKGRKKKSE